MLSAGTSARETEFESRMTTKHSSLMKAFLKSIPVIGPLLVHLRRRQDDFRSPSEYWDRRYRTGGDSGAGSYNRLAQFKANFLNMFVDQHQIASVVEYGSGDGAQPSMCGTGISRGGSSRTSLTGASSPHSRTLILTIPHIPNKRPSLISTSSRHGEYPA